MRWITKAMLFFLALLLPAIFWSIEIISRIEQYRQDLLEDISSRFSRLLVRAFDPTEDGDELISSGERVEEC